MNNITKDPKKLVLGHPLY